MERKKKINKNENSLKMYLEFCHFIAWTHEAQVDPVEMRRE